MSEKEKKNYSNKSPDEYWDYIVIGSGMGGMCSAALLAKLGKKVLILEQHYIPGGFTHTFKRKHWEWDVGVHAVGEVTEHSMIGRLLSKLSNNKLKWTSLGDVYDEFYFPDDFYIGFPDSPQKFRQNLVEAFPDEVEAIDKYLDYVKLVSNSMKKYYLSRAFPKTLAPISELVFEGDAKKFLVKNTKQVLDELTDNYKLKSVLSSQWGYYGSPPSRSSFAIHALVTKHFSHGGYYPIGGSRKISDGLLETVAEAGGWTRVRADVSEIILKKNEAIGVRLKDGEEIFADKIISAAGALETVRRLLPDSENKKKWIESINTLKPSSAHICLNIGFKGDISKAGAGSSNKWFWETWNPEIEAWDIDDPNSVAPILYTSFPSMKDPEHDGGKDELNTGEVVTFVPYESFVKWKDSRLLKRGEDYESLKNNVTERLLKQFLKFMPKLEPMIDFYELSTPLSTEHFTRAMSGAIYGIEPTPDRYKNPWMRPQTPIKNLYLSGSDMATVGVIGAMVGGILAVTASEPIKAIKYLKNT